MAFHFSPADNLVLMSLEGEYSFQDIVDEVDAVHEHPDFHHGLNRVFEVDGVTRLTFLEDGKPLREQVTDLIAYANSKQILAAPGVRVAIVSSRDFGYAIARAYDAYSQGDDSQQVFRTRADALRWLAVSEDSPLYQTG